MKFLTFLGTGACTTVEDTLHDGIFSCTTVEDIFHDGIFSPRRANSNATLIDQLQPKEAALVLKLICRESEVQFSAANILRLGQR